MSTNEPAGRIELDRAIVQLEAGPISQKARSTRGYPEPLRVAAEPEAENLGPGGWLVVFEPSDRKTIPCKEGRVGRSRRLGGMWQASAPGTKVLPQLIGFPTEGDVTPVDINLVHMQAGGKAHTHLRNPHLGAADTLRSNAYIEQTHREPCRANRAYLDIEMSARRLRRDPGANDWPERQPEHQRRYGQPDRDVELPSAQR